MRGAATPLALEVQAASAADRDLADQLRARITAPQNPSRALLISDTRLETQTASIDTQGVAREFLLVLHSHYQIGPASEVNTAPRQRLQLQREYSYTSNNPLATEFQAQALRNDLLRDAAEQILRNLGQ